MKLITPTFVLFLLAKVSVESICDAAGLRGDAESKGFGMTGRNRGLQTSTNSTVNLPAELFNCTPDCSDGPLLVLSGCANGICVLLQVTCENSSEVTNLTCDPPCNDGDLCTTNTCVNGNCVFSDVVCPANESCDPVDGSCKPDGCIPACDDGDLCTVDACNNGTCVFTNVLCSNPNESCDPADGLCKAIAPSWNLMGTIYGESGGDLSGRSVSLSANGTVVAIGSPLSDYSGTDSGHVGVFGYQDQIGWAQLGNIIRGEGRGGLSGRSVSLSADGTVVAIGVRYNSNNNGYRSGHARVFQYSLQTGWTQRGTDIDGEASNDVSGRSVSLSSDGNVLAIGAVGNDGNGTNSGHVRVYEYDNAGMWTQRGGDIDGEKARDESGYSVSLSSDGTVVAISAKDNDGNGASSGHVRVYEYNSTMGWTQRGGDIDGEKSYDGSGDSVSLSSNGTVVAIGTASNDGGGTNSGSVRVYEYDVGSGWMQRSGDIDGEGANDSSGFSVSLSSDGNVLAVGAYLNNGNGTDSGHVRVYEYVNYGWTQRGSDIDGPAKGSRSGVSVSLSSDGSVVATGEYYHGANGAAKSGQVRVFKFGRGT